MTRNSPYSYVVEDIQSVALRIRGLVEVKWTTTLQDVDKLECPEEANTLPRKAREAQKRTLQRLSPPYPMSQLARLADFRLR